MINLVGTMFESESSAGIAGTAVQSEILKDGGRLQRERRTVAAMIRVYCRARHGHRAELCAECRDLLDYASLRLDRCRFGAEKPTCANCPVHCYPRQRRDQIKTVMRLAGPRMLWHHPILSLRHWIDGLTSRSNRAAHPGRE